MNMKDKVLYSNYNPWEITIDEDNIEAIYYAGCKLAAKGYYAEAMSNWLLASDYGSPDSEYRIGLCYLRGAGSIKKDIFKAFYWLQSAAQKGHVDAAVQLVSYYERQYYVSLASFHQAFGLKKERSDDSRQLNLWAESELDALSEEQKSGENEQELIMTSFQLLESLNITINNYAVGYSDDYGYDWRMLKRSQRILKSNKPKEEKIKKLREILDYFTGKYANKKRNL